MKYCKRKAETEMKKRSSLYDLFLSLTKNIKQCLCRNRQLHNINVKAEEEFLSVIPTNECSSNAQKRNNFICRIIAITSALLLVSATVFAAYEIKGTSEIYDNILRLHVIANSDKANDQELKLKVRDAVLSELQNAMNSAMNSEQAETVAKEKSSSIVRAAERVIEENGHFEKVRIDFVKEYYPTKEYEGVKLPAGIYSSVKIVIGEGNGKNWWCVLFPALCTNMAKPTETFQQVGFTPGQVKVLTESENPKYVLKFRFLEIIGEFSGKLFK